ncbi:MAG: hypothetical protein WB564_05465 [Dehalococcoidia bacterium]
MRQEIFSKTAIRYLVAVLVLALSLLPVNALPAAAQDISEYFDISYEPAEFVDAHGNPITDIYGSEIFYVELQGSAICKQDLPSPYDQVKGLKLTFRVIAEYESGGDVTLNGSYTITVEPLPTKMTDSPAEINEDIPLQFPGGSRPGTYNVSSELIKAEAKILFWWDITEQIPSQYCTQPMDSPVTYTTPLNSAPNMPHDPSPANAATGISLPVTLSVAVTDIDNDAITVTFFDASDHSVIGSHAGVPSGSRAVISWSGLAADTIYSWYANANDGEFSTQSDTWSFTTAPANTAPNPPSNPSPIDHATRIPISADLSWTGGDPDPGDTVTYDIYFGTSSSPPLVSNHLSETAYDLATLAYNTKYYWKIVATDNHGASTIGPVWDFTTQTQTPVNNPPNTPSNPSPANLATGVAINASLSWSGGDPDAGDTVTYDVYFGISSPPPLVSANQARTSYDPGTLAYNTKYYWKIVAVDEHGASITGSLYNFITQAEPINSPRTFPWWWAVVGSGVAALPVYFLWWRRRYRPGKAQSPLQADQYRAYRERREFMEGS